MLDLSAQHLPRTPAERLRDVAEFAEQHCGALDVYGRGDSLHQRLQREQEKNAELTRLLEESLGGNSQTVMLACASPADIDAVETLSTLHAVRAARMITNKPKAVHAAAPTLTNATQPAPPGGG